MCKGDINRHQPKTAKINLGLNHHVLNSRTALTRHQIWQTYSDGPCKQKPTKNLGETGASAYTGTAPIF